MENEIEKLKSKMLAEIIQNKERIWWPALWYKTLIELEKKWLV